MSKPRIVFNTKKSTRYLVSGDVGSGKSSTLEYAAELHLNAGWMVFDAYGSSDYENLFWVVCEDAWRIKRGLSPTDGEGGVRYKIGVINPSYVDMVIPKPARGWIKTYSHEQDFVDVFSECVSDGRVLVFNNTAFDPEHAVHVLNDIFWKLPRVTQRLKQKTFVLVRESADLAPVSGAKLLSGSDESKNVLYKLSKESRHAHISIALDIHRQKSVHHNLRNLSAVTILKRSVPESIPDHLMWLINRIEVWRQNVFLHGGNMYAANTKYPSIGSLTPAQFYCVWPDQHFKFGSHPLPRFHHKREMDDFEGLTGVKFVRDVRKEEKVLRYMSGATNHEEWLDNIVEVVSDEGDRIWDLMEKTKWRYGLPKFRKLVNDLKGAGVLQVKGGVVRLV